MKQNPKLPDLPEDWTVGNTEAVNLAAYYTWKHYDVCIQEGMTGAYSISVYRKGRRVASDLLSKPWPFDEAHALLVKTRKRFTRPKKGANGGRGRARKKNSKKL